MKILWLTNIPSPYRVDFFNKLGEHHDLTVLFEKRKSNEREKGWEKYEFNNFKGIFLNGISTGTDSAYCPSCIKYIKSGEYDKIFVTNFSDLTGIHAIFYMKINKIPYLIESDGGVVGQENLLKKYIKKLIIKGAELYFSTSNIHDNYYIQYGANEKNIVRFPFSSVTNKDIVSSFTTIEEKQKMREEFNLPINKKIVITVGQFIHRKGFDILLKAAKDINGHIIIIGGEVNEEYREIIEDYEVNNVSFLPFMSKEKLFLYMRAADVFILPTREDIWGLVINEALSQGIPTITTYNCLAGTELIRNDYNGYLYSCNDTTEMTYCVNKLLNLEDLKYYELSQNSINTAKMYTIETMVKSHLNFIK